ncbi:hypothetical protein diail_6401 [Diaporthe ilicicola]|nr:hypothetical protein diail_6401 [Diaporthe ilicicola]
MITSPSNTSACNVAVGHHDIYKTDEFLDIIIKYVHLLHATFGPAPGHRKAYPGHPEIELALLRLYSTTGGIKAYELAKFSLDERGGPTGQDEQHYYDWEMERPGEEAHKRPNSHPMSRDYWYFQAHKPIPEQESVEGHAVRATYLPTGVADLLCLHKDGWEGFGIDYFLPQAPGEGGCYAETCASIGAMMLAEFLLHLDLNSRYAAVLELCLYNTTMGSMSRAGKAFTYENYLASCLGHLSRREVWFECWCCPPNMSRLFGSLGGYVWHFGTSDEADEAGSRGKEGEEAFINVHLYTSANLEFKTPRGRTPSLRTTVRLRILSWSRGAYEKGYLALSPSYLAANPSFSLLVQGFEPRFIAPHRRSNQRTLALARGPVVYCVEEVDNEWEGGHFRGAVVDKAQPVVEKRERGGERYVALRGRGWTRNALDWDLGGRNEDEDKSCRKGSGVYAVLLQG